MEEVELGAATGSPATMNEVVVDSTSTGFTQRGYQYQPKVDTLISS